MRDALSILERCLQDGIDNIDEDKIKELVGIPKIVFVNKIVKAILEYNVEDALQALEEVLQDGKDINNLLWEIIKYVKDILMFKTTKELQIYSKDELEQIAELEKNTSKERLINIIYSLSETENNIKWSSQKNIMLQTGIIKLCASTQADGLEELKNKINILEQKIATGNIVVNSSNSKNISQTTKIANNQNSNKTPSRPIKKSENYWQDILNNLKSSGKMVLYSNLISTRAVQIDDLTVGIEFPNGLTAFGKTLLEKPENINELTKQISMACGKEMRVKYIDLKSQNNDSEDESIEQIAKDLDIPINIIEE